MLMDAGGFRMKPTGIGVKNDGQQARARVGGVLSDKPRKRRESREEEPSKCPADEAR
jgi:hypothetical protein